MCVCECARKRVRVLRQVVHNELDRLYTGKCLHWIMYLDACVSEVTRTKLEHNDTDTGRLIKCRSEVR